MPLTRNLILYLMRERVVVVVGVVVVMVAFLVLAPAARTGKEYVEWG